MTNSWVIQIVTGKDRKEKEVTIQGPTAQRQFLLCLKNMYAIIEARRAKEKTAGTMIAFHLINKRAIEALQKDDSVDTLAEMSFDDNFAGIQWDKVKNDVLDSLNTDELYLKTCKLFNAEPVDSLEFAALFNGPCYKTLTGIGAPLEYAREPFASIINFVLYTFQ